MTEFTFSEVAQPTLLDELYNELKACDVEFSYPKLLPWAGYNGGQVLVTLYETVALTQENTRKFETCLYNFVKKHKNETIAFIDYKRQNYGSATENVKNYEVRLTACKIKRRSKQTSIKVNGQNWEQILVEYADPEQGKFSFGRGKYFATNDVAIILDGKIRHYTLPNSGLFVKLSQELSMGKSSQEVISDFSYVEFEL